MKKSGFSMIELLLAMAIGGLLLVGAVSLLVTVSQAWANRPATRDAFDAHVNGVANFLHAVMEEASLPQSKEMVTRRLICKNLLGFQIQMNL